MVRDIPTEIINESVRRLVDQVMDEIIIDIPPDCPVRHNISPEQIKRMAAVRVVVARIIQLASWN